MAASICPSISIQLTIPAVEGEVRNRKYGDLAPLQLTVNCGIEGYREKVNLRRRAYVVADRSVLDLLSIVEGLMKAVGTVSATEFKQHCHALLEEKRQTRQSVLVTCHPCAGYGLMGRATKEKYLLLNEIFQHALDIDWSGRQLATQAEPVATGRLRQSQLAARRTAYRRRIPAVPGSKGRTYRRSFGNRC
jgi:hypothetical protein